MLQTMKSISMKHRMNIAGAILVVAAIGCSKSKKTDEPAQTKKASATAPTTAPEPAKPVDAATVVDAAPAPMTPAPGEHGIQIKDLEGGDVVSVGLPAIREDGRQVVTIATGDDGGRGYLNASIVTLDSKTGKTLSRTPIATPDEVAVVVKNEPKSAAATAIVQTISERVATVNKLFADGKWRTMEPTKRTGTLVGDGLQPVESLVAGDMTFTFDAPKAALKVVRAGKDVAKFNVVALIPKAAKPKADPIDCPADEAFLQAIFIDTSSAHALIEFGRYNAGHNCGSEQPTYLVISLPK